MLPVMPETVYVCPVQRSAPHAVCVSVDVVGWFTRQVQRDRGIATLRIVRVWLYIPEAVYGLPVQRVAAAGRLRQRRAMVGWFTVRFSVIVESQPCALVSVRL